MIFPLPITYVYHGDELLETIQGEITWEEIRRARDRELDETDWWAVKDLTMSQARKDYRQFLRDLPQNYDSAWDAAVAINDCEVPA